MKISVLAAAAVALMLSAAPARADDASRAALAHEIVTSMNVEHTVDEMFQQIGPMFATQAAQEMHLSAPEQTRLGQIFSEELHNAVPQLMDAVTSIYAQNIPEDQLVQIRDFLKSPAGHAWIANEGATQQQLQQQARTIGMQVAGRALQRFGQERQAGTIH